MIAAFAHRVQPAPALLRRQAPHASYEILRLLLEAGKPQIHTTVIIRCLATEKTRQIHGYDRMHRSVIGREMPAFPLVLAKQRVQRGWHPAQPEGKYDGQMRCPGDSSDSVCEWPVLFHTSSVELFHFGTTSTRAL